MNLSIRQAKPEDAPALCRLCNEAMGYCCTEEQLRSHLLKVINDPAQALYVAEVDGNPAGFIHAADYLLLYAPPMKNILDLAVSVEFRKLGIGKMLLQAVEKWAAENGTAAVRLSSGFQRAASHEFYRRCGYHNKKMQLCLIKEL
ncbi:MAG: GNAT family N-acetyltransferase [Angelakisella sp.]|nr:GNAT family N-acetyltransferase [Angelakisella sp.]